MGRVCLFVVIDLFRWGRWSGWACLESICCRLGGEGGVSGLVWNRFVRVVKVGKVCLFRIDLFGWSASSDQGSDGGAGGHTDTYTHS